jgi:hypothetical protein
VFDAREITRALDGTWRLLLNRPDALRFFNITSDGFWRSFAAVFLVLPFYLLTVLTDRDAMLADPTTATLFDETTFWAVKIVTLGVDWVALPILLAALAGFLRIRRNYPTFMVVRNWGAVLTIPPFALIALLEEIGIVDADIALILSLAALGVALRYSYMAARRALVVGMDVAVLFVLLDFLVSLAIVRIIGRLSGVEMAGG